jgi:predicted nucleic acid-binding protein
VNVYVESNFVLELALEQEQGESCEQLIRLAAGGAIHLIIPAFSLAEPHITLMRKGNERSRLSVELQKQLTEIRRSKPYRDTSSSFSELTALLIRSAEREHVALQDAIDKILEAATVIPLDSDVLHRANKIQVAFDMSFQDSIVLASVVRHLAETKPAGGYFLNRNTKDFDDPNVREMLNEFGCRFFGRFDDAVSYIATNPSKTRP